MGVRGKVLSHPLSPMANNSGHGMKRRITVRIFIFINVERNTRYHNDAAQGIYCCLAGQTLYRHLHGRLPASKLHHVELFASLTRVKTYQFGEVQVNPVAHLFTRSRNKSG